MKHYNIQNYSKAWNGLPEELLNNYEPTDVDREIVRERINEKLQSKYE